MSPALNYTAGEGGNSKLHSYWIFYFNFFVELGHTRGLREHKYPSTVTSSLHFIVISDEYKEYMIRISPVVFSAAWQYLQVFNVTLCVYTHGTGDVFCPNLLSDCSDEMKAFVLLKKISFIVWIYVGKTCNYDKSSNRQPQKQSFFCFLWEDDIKRHKCKYNNEMRAANLRMKECKDKQCRPL